MSENKPPLPVLADFPFVTRDKLRYGDTDRQGHVNNAVYATFFETGRVDMLMSGGELDQVDLKGEDGAFVIARLIVDYRSEINWPGEVEIGTRVLSLGRSSLRLGHAVFFNGACAASGESVVVLTDSTTRRSKPFDDAARAWLVARIGAP
jgi:acyl-CoA thioester hydrolase